MTQSQDQNQSQSQQGYPDKDAPVPNDPNRDKSKDAVQPTSPADEAQR